MRDYNYDGASLSGSFIDRVWISTIIDALFTRISVTTAAIISQYRTNTFNGDSLFYNVSGQTVLFETRMRDDSIRSRQRYLIYLVHYTGLYLSFWGI